MASRVENRGAVTVVSRWLIDLAFAAPPQSGLAWFCFLLPSKNRVRMRYKRFSRVVSTFSIPKFRRVFEENEFFNTHRRLHSERVGAMEAFEACRR
jgi:hypothetical protein